MPRPGAQNGGKHDAIVGPWSCRWNGGADPTIPGDTQDKWKQGRGDVRVVVERVYLLFDWDSGARKGLIDARRAGASWSVSTSISPIRKSRGRGSG